MDRIERLGNDLRFVRGALDASTQPGTSPSGMYFLWAAIIAVGFPLADFRADWVPRYWAVAGPAGFLASAYLGWRHASHTGQASASDGRRHLLHWSAVLVAIALAVALRVRGGMPPETLHAVILIVLALGHFTAGLYLDRPLRWAGLGMAGGVLVVMLMSALAWTVVAVALAAGLTFAGVRAGRPA
jgi:hypothetical protein